MRRCGDGDGDLALELAFDDPRSLVRDRRAKSSLVEVANLAATDGRRPIDAAAGVTTSVERLAGQTLHLAMGVPVAIGGGDGLRFVKLQYVTVVFSR